MAPHLEKALRILSSSPKEIKELNRQLLSVLASEDKLRAFIARSLGIETLNNAVLTAAHEELKLAMNEVATHLSSLWSDDRYVRAPFDFEAE